MWRLCMIILLFVVENEPRSIDEIISAAQEAYDDGKTREDAVFMPQGSTGESAEYMPQGSSGEYFRVELDMILPLETWLIMNDADQNVTTQRHKRKAANDRTLWGRIIPYTVDDRFTAEERLEIEGAIAHWTLYTCLSFREKSPSDLNSINFLPTADSHYLICSSFVGMIGGDQTIVLPEGCREKMVIIHEIGHAIGLYHEHQRTDRDDYVTINWDNLIEDTKDYVKLKPSMENNYSIPYDYTSIMHYGKTFMSKEKGLVTMVTKDQSYQDTIGEANVLSFNDIQMVNAMYRCAAGCVPKECPIGGFLGKQGCTCWCRGSVDRPVVKCDMEVPVGQCGVPDIDTEVYNVTIAVRWEPVDLDMVQSFPNGTELNVDFKHCNCGSELKKIVCVQGNWTGQPPACQPVDISCILPKSHDPDDTNYLYKRGNENLVKGEAIDHNETVTVGCEFLNLENYDYENGLVETNITCSNGTWIGEHPQNCSSAPVKCSNITNGSVGNGSLLSGYVVTCDKGYQLDDVYGIGIDKFYCESDGIWARPAPLCHPKSCKLPPYGGSAGDIVKFVWTEKLFLSRHADIQHNDTVTQICPKGDFPSERTVTCTLGAWNTDDGEFPLCKKVRCRPPPVTNVAYYPMKKKYKFNESVDINKCRNILEFVGDHNIRCQADSTWSGSATCRTFCKDGEIQNEQIMNMQIRAKGRTLRGVSTFDRCKKRCEQNKRFLCRSIEFGYEDHKWKCILHPQNPESNPEILDTRHEWTVVYRNCTQNV